MGVRAVASAFIPALIIYNACVVADGIGIGSAGTHPMRADGHAPIRVMGDHIHERGEWMLSYRYTYMDVQGNRIGDDEVSPDAIATTAPNRFFGAPMQPPTLRVVPTDMTMETHMFGAMYAPTDWLTLMFMTSYIEKEMDHVTYMGGLGTTVRGGFTTRTDGIGDSKFTGLIRLFNDGTHRAHIRVGISAPTGATDETDTVLTPLGTMPSTRLPYAMQIGSGTVDFLPGITYSGKLNRLGWGGQYVGDIRTERDDGYRWGHKHVATGWLSYQPRPFISVSTRLAYESMGGIEGIDARIVAPVQTADPNNYGGDKLNLLFGINLAGQTGRMRGMRIALEGGFPFVQHLNGPQMETDFILTAGAQVMF